MSNEPNKAQTGREEVDLMFISLMRGAQIYIWTVSVNLMFSF